MVLKTLIPSLAVGWQCHEEAVKLSMSSGLTERLVQVIKAFAARNQRKFIRIENNHSPGSNKSHFLSFPDFSVP